MAPTTDQINKLAQEWDSTDQTAFMSNMYQSMFRTHPEWQEKFKKLTFPIDESDAAFKKQVEVTVVLFERLIRLAQEPDHTAFMKEVHALGKRHIGYQVQQTEFQKLKPILADVTDQSAIQGADKEAWAAFCHYLLDNLVPE